MAEIIEMDNLGRYQDREDQQNLENENENGFEESNLFDNNDNPLDISIPDPTGFNPDIDAVPSIRRDVGVMKRSYVLYKKNFLKRELGINLNKGDGPSSIILFDKMEIGC